ncbi:unnamed protein product [Victoria cruziana]
MSVANQSIHICPRDVTSRKIRPAKMLTEFMSSMNSGFFAFLLLCAQWISSLICRTSFGTTDGPQVFLQPFHPGYVTAVCSSCSIRFCEMVPIAYRTSLDEKGML